MIKRTRLLYAILVIVIIGVGLLSRKIAVIPLATGDALWATMIYFILRCLMPQQPIKRTALFSVLLCFAVEASQAYHAPWIDAIRSTLPGRLVLGQGFLWSDLPAYVLGVAFGLLIDYKLVIKKNKK
ncbi:DUF2809 domain-containing protein [Taibaiella chishuiensis]|uniref:Uncharacterized protein DUF2809 n=1 Tax=Taibaiella chishuiensis TaxID=1434707 RepID=A0A2P8DAW0_9BACT|nr:DUF2809 domain-containing protein [Taibaiella chishuiensis]PSK94353.1 uncharacterized protein DUF2809 [Taibaiella chishuiensis]